VIRVLKGENKHQFSLVYHSIKYLSAQPSKERKSTTTLVTQVPYVV